MPEVYQKGRQTCCPSVFMLHGALLLQESVACVACRRAGRRGCWCGRFIMCLLHLLTLAPALAEERLGCFHLVAATRLLPLGCHTWLIPAGCHHLVTPTWLVPRGCFCLVGGTGFWPA